MVIERFGLTLTLLTENDLELVRQWRNSETVNRHLINRETITGIQQKAWFEKIQHEQSLYFIIELNGTRCGLIYLTNINWQQRSFESNIFMGVEAYIHSFAPVYAALTLSDLFFLNLNFQKSYSRVALENNAALGFDYELGYRFDSEQKPDGPYKLIYATQQSYTQATSQFYARIKKRLAAADFCRIAWDEAEEQHAALNQLVQELKQAGLVVGKQGMNKTISIEYAPVQ